MTTEEEFKEWLITVHRLSRFNKAFNARKHYAAGLRAINKILDLHGEGIFDAKTDLAEVLRLLTNSADAKPHHFTHLRAFQKFRAYKVKESDKSIPPLLRQTDVLKKQRVERAAVEMVIRHYETLHYKVGSKEADNLGWDLEATKDADTLLLEVKGLSGSVTSIELSPNEYKNSNEKSNQYRLCIVTNALTQPTLEIFSFESRIVSWVNDKGEKLVLKEMTGARLYKS